MTPATHAGEALAAGLPALLVAAERVAATVAQGLHGRRRVGTGENFWQFRPYVAGDGRGKIDWRRSARSGREFVRETEWDAAQTVALWRDGGAALRWRSATDLPEKRERADLLLLATASLLLRGGERVRLLEGADANAAGLTAGSAALPRIAAALQRADGTGLPAALPPAHAAMVLFGDFWGDLDGLAAVLAACAVLPARGVLVQVLDPAEIELPYAGRIAFVPLSGGASVVLPKVEAVRDAYAQRFAARQETLGALCRRTGFLLHTHRTDAPPQTALLAIHAALSQR